MPQVYVEKNYASDFLKAETVIFASKATTTVIEKEQDKQKNSLFKTVDIWIQRSRQRKQLSQLEPHLLKDIGLTEEMVAEEIAKPFWK